jgi:hypothetical protein
LVLLQEMREAESAGHGWELTTIAGRSAVRIRRVDGVRTSFLSDEEKRELEAALDAGTPVLELEGLPRCEWKAREHAFRGERDGHDVVIHAPSTATASDVVSLVDVYARVCARLPVILEEVAAKMGETAKRWGAHHLAKRMRLASIGLVAGRDEAHLFLSDGGAFAGHSIEVWLDAEARVSDAALIG